MQRWCGRSPSQSRRQAEGTSSRNKPHGYKAERSSTRECSRGQLRGPKIGERVKLYSRPGNDLTWRFPLIVEATVRLRLQSCVIDGEAVACGKDGLSSFDRIRHRRYDESVFMWA